MTFPTHGELRLFGPWIHAGHRRGLVLSPPDTCARPLTRTTVPALRPPSRALRCPPNATVRPLQPTPGVPDRGDGFPRWPPFATASYLSTEGRFGPTALGESSSRSRRHTRQQAGVEPLCSIHWVTEGRTADATRRPPRLFPIRPGEDSRMVFRYAGRRSVHQHRLPTGHALSGASVITRSLAIHFKFRLPQG